MEDTNISLMQEFNKDTEILCEQTNKFLQTIYPNYLIPQNEDLSKFFDDESSILLDSIKFFRIGRCTIDSVDDVFGFVNQKIEKLFTALHSINVTVTYGIVSYNGTSNIVLGILKNKDVETTKSIVQGILSGIELEEFDPDFEERDDNNKNYGVLTGIPTTILNDEKQTFSLSAIMKSLNGQNYTVLYFARPINMQDAFNKINTLIEIRDKCFAISKRNVSRQISNTHTKTDTDNESETNGKSKNVSGSGAGLVGGAAMGAGIGAVVGSIVPGAGTAVGAILGAKLGGTLGTIIGSSFSVGKNSSKTIGYSKAISDAITEGESVSGDIQNGFALELMNYADKAIERLKAGQNNGMWLTAISYSAETEIARNIIQACLCSELSKPNPDALPLQTFSPVVSNTYNQELLIPTSMFSELYENPMCSYLNSSEIGLICTIPTECVPDFELRIGKSYPLIKNIVNSADAIKIGNLVDGNRSFSNMPFMLSESDLNKHTFICGITGSGKTTTVKKILTECKKPFMVIESAKKEYRNIKVEAGRKPVVYTLGKPEINCLRMNPFYIMPGVSPQTHIDFLKDLFNASFSFYGPMPYILEKCLYNVYKNKGWNLTLGFHPYFVNQSNTVDFFDIDYMQKRYELLGHKFLFPTMQELKNEIARYIQEELQYDGEVAGNIKTAIMARLENLCSGAKGYMFNTTESINFTVLLSQNVIFELEGLADDSDKAFCVGMLVIFINEFRQIHKEAQGNKKLELQHLLVIEEAHRLLKNIETERTNENMGNPKGKAVEHFTNMIAEMRSYGQGVIIAEQIPSKLAPDVIKNSSNKIVQRVVSADDQEVIANTIGICSQDAIYIGSLKTGYALCHKEGMHLPVFVNIDKVEDTYVSDEILYNSAITERMHSINVSMVTDAAEEKVDMLALRLLNTLIIESPQLVVASINDVKEAIMQTLRVKDIHLVPGSNYDKVLAELISGTVARYLMSGVYSIKKVLSDKLLNVLQDIFTVPTDEKVIYMQKLLTEAFEQNSRNRGKITVAELIKNQWDERIDLVKTIVSYFVKCSDVTQQEICTLIKGREQSV